MEKEEELIDELKCDELRALNSEKSKKNIEEKDCCCFCR